MAQQPTQPIGVFTKDAAQEILLAFRQLRAAGLLNPGTIQALINSRAQLIEAPKQFTNKSSTTCPPYACMQIIGTETIGETCFLQIDQPADADGLAGPYIFNSHYAVEAGAQGIAQKHRIVRARSNGDVVVAGEKWQPVVGDWTIDQNDSGQWTICGEDEPATDVFTDPIVRIEIGGTGAGGGAKILYTIDSLTTAGSSSPYNGLRVATVTVVCAPCDRSDLIGTSLEVVDWLECLFNEPDADLLERKGTAFEGIAESLASGAAAGTLTDCHWIADALCC